MPHRSIIDQHGNLWDVWDTHPDARSQVSPHYRGGWLTFETDGPPKQKRRLAPLPERWQIATDEELLGMLIRAEPVKFVSIKPIEGGQSTMGGGA